MKKPGKLDPFAYHELNPKMMNHRDKHKATKSFQSVVAAPSTASKSSSNRQMVRVKKGSRKGGAGSGHAHAHGSRKGAAGSRKGKSGSKKGSRK
jgi:hypothetical protein